MPGEEGAGGEAGACRVFFKELMSSDFVIDNTVVTPTCARCSTLFGVGEVKEVERRGRITKLRIDDSTAVINLYTDIEMTFKPESFVAFLGNIRIRHHESGFLILGREMAMVDSTVRDNWILSTAIRTMRRIELLRSMTPVPAATTWMRKALTHYGNKLEECESTAIKAVQQLWQYYNRTAKDVALDFLNTVDKCSRERLIAELEKKGLEGAWIEEAIDELIADGMCYEPEAGVLALVHQQPNAV
ncbi:MAG: hypothetical protein J7I99_06475 [Methanophagales archaeon]|nr:hypothetical protein [Methanophagales archaeon]